MAAWVTEAEAEAITGVNVTATDVANAQGVIEVYAGRTYDDTFLDRDLRWLKRAVAWQAAWQPQQAGYEARNNATNVEYDTVRVARDTEHSVTLAPLAARALKNLSWKSGARRARASRTGVYGSPWTNFTLESSDQFSGWASL